MENTEVEINKNVSIENNIDETTKTSIFDEIVFYILLLSTFLLPFFFIPYAGISVDLQKSLILTIAISISLFIFLIARLKDSSYKIPKSPILLSGAVLVLIYGLSAIFSPAVRESLSGFAYNTGTFGGMFIMFSLLFLTSITFQSSRKIFLFYGALFTSFGVLFLFHLLRIIFGTDLFSFGTFLSFSDSLIGKWNDFGVFAGVITLLSLMALEFISLKKGQKYFIYIALWGSLIALSVVNLYLSWILIGIFSLVLLVYKLTFDKKSKDSNVRNLSTPSLTVLLISFLFIIAGSSLGGFISNYTRVSQIEARPSWSATIDITKQVWSERPLLGSGPNRFTNEWLKNKPVGINQTIFWNTDFNSGIGLIPSFATTTGILGTLAWIVFLGFILYSGVRKLFLENAKIHYFAFSSFVVSIYLWTVTIFYVPSIAIFALAFLMTGISIAFSTQKGLIKNINLTHIRDPRISFVSTLVLLILLIGTVSWIYTLGKKVTSVAYLQKGRIAINIEGNLDKGEEYLLKAVSLNNSDVLYRSLAEIERIKLSALFSQENISPESARVQFQTIFGNAIGAARSAVQFDETNYLNWLSLFRVYSDVVQLNVVSGAYDNAIVSLDRARALNPLSPALLLELAQLEIIRGNSSVGREVISEALIMKNNYTDAIFLLAQLDIREGNTDKAIESLESATFINPNDTGLFFNLGLLKYNDSDYIGAISSFERVIILNPNYANAKYFLGLSYYRVGDEDLAIEQFEGVKVLNPENVDVETILNNMKAGESLFSDTETSDIGEPPLDE